MVYSIYIYINNTNILIFRDHIPLFISLFIADIDFCLRRVQRVHILHENMEHAEEDEAEKEKK